MARKKKIIKKAVAVDMTSGSMAYNRLDMQVSQCLHMAIELYPNLNYLFVLDHYDDITLFDDDVSPQTVSYYQMKSSEDSISIDTAISEEWIAKLYEQLQNPEWFIDELGLITNCPLKITVRFDDSNGKKHTEVKKYSADRTSFNSFSPIAIQKIKEDISQRKGIPLEDVDLSKFAHMRTVLSIPKHREIVEQEMSGFLQKLYPRITVESVKTIYATMLDLLTKRQEYELLSKDSPFAIVREKKGVSKAEFVQVIEDAMMLSLPAFGEISRVAGYIDDEKYKAALEYANLLSDLQGKSPIFTDLFLKTKRLCLDNPRTEDESVLDYCDRIYSSFLVKNPIYNKFYIEVLVISILISEWRRS